MGNLIRELNNIDTITNFVSQIFSRECAEFSKESSEHLFHIADAELALLSRKEKSTLFSPEYRLVAYKSEGQRKHLREQIVKELYELELLDDDNDICLGKGGARPKSGIKHHKTAYYIIGLPASGKSSICHTLAEKANAIILDSDFAKQKLPEISYNNGATLTHDESRAIIFGHKSFPSENNLSSIAIQNKDNIIIPKIGSKISNLMKECEPLKNHGYKIHLILVRLDRKYATQRAYYRFVESKRYVPLALIYDGYANEPTIVYYDLKRLYKNIFSSFTMIDSNVSKGEKYHIIECSSKHIKSIFDETMICDC